MLTGEKMANIVFLLLIIISGVIADDSYYASSSPSSRIPDFSDDFKFNDLTSNQTRSRRNADPLSDYSGKLSTVARISNGISLLAGLINKNIPIDTVIQELLHFGNVKLADVVAIQKDKVEAVISQLEAINKSLVTNTVEIILEETTIGMGRVRDTFIESDFGNFKHLDDYFKEAQSFKDDTTTDYAAVKSTTTVVKEALERIENLENPPPITNMNSGMFDSHIIVLRGRLESVESAPASFAKIVQNLESLSKLSNGAAILKPMQKMLDLLAVHRELSSIVASDVPEAGKNFDKISPLSTTFAQSNLAVLTDLISSRLKSSSTKRQYTPGFPNGASDLKKLVRDIRDPSFETTIGDGKNFARLSAGLKPLKGFSTKLEASEAQLKPLATVEILKSVGNAVELQTLMTGLTVTSDDAIAVTQLLFDNQFDIMDKIRVAPAVTFMENAVKVSGELVRIKSSASAFPPPPQEVTDVKEILEKLPPKIGPQHVQKVVDELKGVPDKVKKVKEYLEQLQDLLKDVPDPTVTRQTAELIVKAEGDLKKIKVIIDRDVVPKLTAIRDMKEPIDKVVRALKATKVIKDFKPEDISNIRSAVDTMSQASNSINDLQKKPNRKKRQTDEVKELIGLEDAQKTSGILGSAAAPIYSMAQLNGLDATVVQDLKTKSTIFETEVANVTDGSKKSEILTKWGDHKAFISSLDSTLGQIKAFEGKLSADEDLRKLGAHLNDAKAVGDVRQNIADKSEAVNLLILETSNATAKADLEKLKTQLDTLAALDLQFSNHHSSFPGVTDALKSLFDFLSEFLDPSSKASAEAAAAAAAAADSGTSIWLFVGIGVVVLALIVVIGILVFCLLKRNKKNKSEVSKKSKKSGKDKKDKEKKEKDDNDKSSPLRKTSGKEEFVIVDLN